MCVLFLTSGFNRAEVIAHTPAHWGVDALFGAGEGEESNEVAARFPRLQVRIFLACGNSKADFCNPEPNCPIGGTKINSSETHRRALKAAMRGGVPFVWLRFRRCFAQAVRHKDATPPRTLGSPKSVER